MESCSKLKHLPPNLYSCKGLIQDTCWSVGFYFWGDYIYVIVDHWKFRMEIVHSYNISLPEHAGKYVCSGLTYTGSVDSNIQNMLVTPFKIVNLWPGGSTACHRLFVYCLPSKKCCSSLDPQRKEIHVGTDGLYCQYVPAFFSESLNFTCMTVHSW